MSVERSSTRHLFETATSHGRKGLLTRNADIPDQVSPTYSQITIPLALISTGFAKLFKRIGNDRGPSRAKVRFGLKSSSVALWLTHVCPWQCLDQTRPDHTRQTVGHRWPTVCQASSSETAHDRRSAREPQIRITNALVQARTPMHMVKYGPGFRCNTETFFRTAHLQKDQSQEQRSYRWIIQIECVQNGYIVTAIVRTDVTTTVRMRSLSSHWLFL